MFWILARFSRLLAVLSGAALAHAIHSTDWIRSRRSATAKFQVWSSVFASSLVEKVARLAQELCTTGLRQV